MSWCGSVIPCDLDCNSDLLQKTFVKKRKEDYFREGDYCLGWGHSASELMRRVNKRLAAVGYLFSDLLVKAWPIRSYILGNCFTSRYIYMKKRFHTRDWSQSLWNKGVKIQLPLFNDKTQRSFCKTVILRSLVSEICSIFSINIYNEWHVSDI